MAGATFAFRIEAVGGDQLEREFARASTASRTFQSATDAMRAALAGGGAGFDALTASLVRADAGLNRSERQVRSSAAAFASLVAGLDPVEAAYQKAARAEAQMTDLQVRGVEVTDRQKRAIAGLRTEYEALAEAEIRAAREAERAARNPPTPSPAAAAPTSAFLPQAPIIQGYRETLKAIDAEERKGLLTASEATAARDRATASYERAREAATGYVSAEERARREKAADVAETDRLTKSLTGLVHATDPLAASLARVTAAEKDLAAATAKGIATPQQVAAVGNLRKSHDDLKASVDKTGTAFGLAGYQINNVANQIVDFGVQVGSGQGIFRPLLQQAPQLLDALGLQEKAFGRLVGAITPARIALGVFGAGMIVAGLIINSRTAELNVMETQLKGIEAAYRGTASAAVDAARAVARGGQGVSVDQALGAQRSLARSAASAGIQGLDYGDLTRQAADLAARLGEDLPAALGRFQNAMRDPAAAIDDLRKAGFPGVSEATRLMVQRLVEAGQPAAAFAEFMRATASAAGAAREAMSPLQRALTDVRSTFGLIWDDISKGVENQGATFLTWVNNVLIAARELRQHNLSDQGPAARQAREEEDRRRTNPPVHPYDPEFRPSLLDTIRRTEGGTADPYNNTVNNNRWRPPLTRFPVSEMTLDAVREEQTRIINAQIAAGVPRDQASGAIGAYQITQGTLDRYRTRLNLPGSAVFDRALQDRIGGAIVSDLGDPNRPGYLDALRGQFHGLRSVPDYQVRSLASITVQAPRVEVENPRNDGVTVTAQGPIPLPPPADPLAAVNRALDIAARRNGMGLPEGTTVEDRAAKARQFLPDLQQGLASARALAAAGVPEGEAALGRLTQTVQEYNQAIERGRGTAALFTRGLSETADIAQITDPAARAAAEAVQQLTIRMRENGEGAPSAAQKAEAVAQALRSLNGGFANASAEAGRSLAAQDRLAEAWGRGRDAVARQTAEEKANETARQFGLRGTAQTNQAIRALADSYETLAQRQADNALRASNDNSQRNLDYLRREGELIGVSATERERELAALKARNDAIASGAKDEDAIRTAERLARAQAEVRQGNQQVQASVDALGSIGENAVERVTQALVENGGQIKSWGTLFKQTIASVSGDLVKLGLVNPVVNTVFGLNRPTLGSGLGAIFGGGIVKDGTGGVASGGLLASLFGGGGSVGAATQARGLGGNADASGTTPAAAGGGGIMSYINRLPNLTNLGGGGGIGGSAIGYIDGALGTGIGSWLRSPVFGQATAPMLGPYSAADPTLAFNASGATGAGAVNSLSYGQAIGGGLSIAGGIYGIYSGIQTGGARGFAQGVAGTAGVVGGAAGIAAGSSAALGIGAGATAALGAIATVAPYIAAIAAVVAMLLPAQKASDMTGTYRLDTVTGQGVEGGLGGKRSSEENRASAKGIAEQLGTIAKNIGAAAGLEGGVVRDNFQVEVGSRDGIKLRAGGGVEGFGTEKDAADNLVQAATRRFVQLAGDQTTDQNIRQIVQARGGSVQAVADFDWYRTTYSEMVKPVEERQTAFAKGLLDLRKPFQDAIDKAKELGLATAVLSTRMTEAEKDYTKRRDEGFASTMTGYRDRTRAADGKPLTLAEQTTAFDRAAKTARTDEETRLRDMGVGGKELAGALAELDKAVSAERAKVVRDYTAAIAAVNQAYDDRLYAATTDTSTQAGALDAFDRGATREMEEAKKGLGDIAKLEAAQAAERLGIIRRFTDAAAAETKRLGATYRDFIDGLKVSPDAGRSPQQRFENASLIFSRDLTLAQAGNADAQGRLTGGAQNLLGAAEAMFASSKSFADIRDYVEASIASLPETVSYDQQMVEALKAANAADLAAKVLLDQIATRAGGEAGAGIVRAALEAGYGATLAALQASSATATVTGERLTALLAANDNAEGAAARGLLATIASHAWTTAVNAGATSTWAYQTSDAAQRGVLAVGGLTERVNVLVDQVTNGTNAWLQQITSGIGSLGKQYAEGLKVTVNVNGSGGRWDDGSGAYGGNGGSGGTDGSAGDSPGAGHESDHSDAGLVDGGWVGNGTWNRDSVRAAYAGGGSIMLAGGEYVVTAPQAARYADVLPAINAGTLGRGGGGDSGAVLAELRRQNALLAEQNGLLRRVAAGVDATAGNTGGTWDGVERLGGQQKMDRLRARAAA